MTHDELRARCAAWIGKNDLSSGDDIDIDLLTALESLCREMIVVGIQKVATHLRTQHLQEYGHARLLGVEGELYDWCQQKAQQVKEGL